MLRASVVDVRLLKGHNFFCSFKNRPCFIFLKVYKNSVCSRCLGTGGENRHLRAGRGGSRVTVVHTENTMTTTQE